MEKRLLYIIDERGLKGGAHIATELMIDALQKRGYTVDVMEAISRDSFWGIIRRAYARIISILHLNLPSEPLFLRDPFGFKYRQMLRYDTVCVMSEESGFRPIVCELPTSVRKVQLIHTNYLMWSKLTKRNIAADEKLFAKFDAIGCVGTIGAKQLEDLFPACKGKVFPFHNLIKKSNDSDINLRIPPQPYSPIRIISLARMGDMVSKDGLRMVRVAKRLIDAGIEFVWDNYGPSGADCDECKMYVERNGMTETFRIHPFDPTARAKIAEADVFLLLSHYEGLPNVIYEAFIAGTPVFATKVGGIPEQIQDGINGWLIDDDEDSIVSRLISVLGDHDGLQRSRMMLSAYTYDNDEIVREHERIYFKP